MYTVGLYVSDAEVHNFVQRTIAGLENYKETKKILEELRRSDSIYRDKRIVNVLGHDPASSLCCST